VPKKIVGAVLLLVLALASAGQDKQKKTLEVVYQEIQDLKGQVQDLRARLDKNAAEVQAIGEQLKILANLVRQSLADQAAVRDDVRVVPAQYQDVLRRLDQLSLDVQKVSADLAVRPPEPQPGDASAAKAAAGGAVAKKSEAKPGASSAQAQTQAPPPVAPASNVSPSEAYRMAYNDYLKGNYDLAIESFKLYRQQFGATPLADNALYWIGECHFSQKKFEEAIDDFNQVILAYPDGDKVAAAYLKKGMSYQELGKKVEALAAFKLLISKYPLQEESKIAEGKIKELMEK
jgi:tol-pal system protein YbgF